MATNRRCIFASGRNVDASLLHSYVVVAGGTGGGCGAAAVWGILVDSSADISDLCFNDFFSLCVTGSLRQIPDSQGKQC